MKTLKLSGSPQALERAKEGATFIKFYRVRSRAVVLVEHTPQVPAGVTITETLKGDNFEIVKTNWVNNSVIEDLQAEFLLNKSITPAKQQRALTKHEQAKTNRRNLEKSLSDAVLAEYEAAANLVRVFGRGPLVIDGKTQDPTYRGELVFYVPRPEMNP